MKYSRLRRYQNQVLQKRFYLAIFGTFSIIVLLFVFGLKILTGFSMILDRLTVKDIQTAENQTVNIAAPILNPTYEATNSANLPLTGIGEPSLFLIIYINDGQHDKFKLPENGVFETEITLQEGENNISAKMTDDKNNLSPLSNTLTVILNKAEPNLNIVSPEDGKTYYAQEKIVQVSGTTDPQNSLTINDRIAVVTPNGSFGYRLSLNSGSNPIRIVATDPAGNTKTTELTVYYEE